MLPHRVACNQRNVAQTNTHTLALRWGATSERRKFITETSLTIVTASRRCLTTMPDADVDVEADADDDDDADADSDVASLSQSTLSALRCRGFVGCCVIT